MSRKRKQPSPSVTSDEEDDLDLPYVGSPDRSVKYSRRPETDQQVLGLDNTSLDTGHLPLQPSEDRVFSDSCTGSDLLLDRKTAQSTPSRLPKQLSELQALVSQLRPVSPSARVSATSVTPVSSASVSSASGASLISVSSSTAASPEKSAGPGRGDKPVIQCPSCDEKFYRNWKFCRHLVTVHNVVSTTFETCEICKRQYDNPQTLKTHMMKKHPETLTEPTGLKCDTCNKVYSNKYTLENHKLRRHGIQKSGFPCPYCNKIYKFSTQLDIHIQNKHPEAKPNTSIPVTANAQSTPSRLPKPLGETPALVSQLRPASPSALVPTTSVAPVSNASVTSASGTSLISVSPSTAASPEKSILGRKHSECSMRASGATPKQLPGETSGLASRDSSEPPSAVPSRSVSATSVPSSSGSDYSACLPRVRCRICGKIFENLDMDHHMQTAHDVETLKLIICEICKRPYDNQDTLRQHVRSEHPETVPERKGLKCDTCNKVFSSKQYLEKHKQKFHGIEISGFPCLYCDKIYKRATQLYTHIQKEHPFAGPNT